MTYYGYPPNSDLVRYSSPVVEGLPVPAYEPAAYVPDVDWAEVLIELAIDRYGGDNRWHPYCHGPTEKCDACGVTWVGDQPCWLCTPQPAAKLIPPRNA